MWRCSYCLLCILILLEIDIASDMRTKLLEVNIRYVEYVSYSEAPKSRVYVMVKGDHVQCKV